VFVVGRTLTITRLAWFLNGEWTEHCGGKIGVPREITKVQTNAIAIGNPRSWIEFGKAGDWSFDGKTLKNETDNCVIEYEVGGLDNVFCAD